MEDLSSSNEEDSTHNSVICTYCGQFVDRLVPKRKYCEQCKERMIRECKRCKLPFDDKKIFENEDSVRCKSCEKRLARERNKRKLGTEEKPKNIKTEKKLLKMTTR